MRYHATAQGNVPFTPEEEAQADIDEVAYLANENAMVRDVKKAAVSAKALEVEQQGVIVVGVKIGTSRADQARITSATKLMGRRPLETVDIETVEGVWISADKATLEAIEDATWGHVKATAANCKAHHAAIDLLTTAQEVRDYDFSAGW